MVSVSTCRFSSVCGLPSFHGASFSLLHFSLVISCSWEGRVVCWYSKSGFPLEVSSHHFILVYCMQEKKE